MSDRDRIAASRGSRVRVWDAPTRVFHWLYLACFVSAWLTRETSLLDWHALAGYSALALLAFRCVWGLVGTEHARFGSFAAGPRAVILYMSGLIRGRPAHFLGHNPAGGWSIFVMLALGIGIGLTGLVALGAMYGYGPLGAAVGPGNADPFRELHEILAWSLLAIVPVHLAGVIAGSLAGRENLVGSMITGSKRREAAAYGVPAHASLGAAVAIAVALGAAAYGWHAQGEISRQRQPSVVAPPDAQARQWNEECGSCHLAYPPVLAPARIWRAMLAPDTDHFGETLDLSTARRAALDGYMAPRAADGGSTWLALRMGSTGWAAPYRITDTPFWKRRHPEPDFTLWKSRAKAAGAHDCGSCHRDALSGTFAPRAIDLP